MNITICGGGHMAHALAGMLGQVTENKITLYTRRPDEWNKTMIVNMEGCLQQGAISLVTNSPEKAVANAGLIILALPSFARKDVIEQIAPYIPENVWIGSFPGMGNFDLIIKDTLNNTGKKIRVFASQRVPYICRTVEYGKSVHITSKKNEIFVSALKQDETPEICKILTPLLGMPVKPLHNFLEITLSTSNPVLHPARTYSLFKNYEPGTTWDRNLLFYETWSHEASEVLNQMDMEVHQVIEQFPFDLSGIRPLLSHYGVTSTHQLTEKIRNIAAFKGITSPMKETGDGWVPDFESRYFTEDITYGLLIIKSIAQIMHVKVPVIDTILVWAQKHMKKTFIVDGLINFSDNKDIPLHQHYGILLPEQLINYYQ